MQVELLLFTFYLNGGLHAVSIRKRSERILDFWIVQFLKTKYEQNFGIPHIPGLQTKMYGVIIIIDDNVIESGLSELQRGTYIGGVCRR